jgi:hypothetical protein
MHNVPRYGDRSVRARTNCQLCRVAACSHCFFIRNYLTKQRNKLVPAYALICVYRSRVVVATLVIQTRSVQLWPPMPDVGGLTQHCSYGSDTEE